MGRCRRWPSQLWRVSGQQYPGPEAAKLVLAQMQAFTDANMKILQMQESRGWLVSPYLRQYGLWEIYGLPTIRRAHAGLRRIPSAWRKR